MSTEFIPLTITECIRALCNLVPGAEMGFISADASVTWIRRPGREEECWTESFTICVGDNLKVTEKTLPEAYKTAREYIWRVYGRE